MNKIELKTLKPFKNEQNHSLCQIYSKKKKKVIEDVLLILRKFEKDTGTMITEIESVVFVSESTSEPYEKSNCLNFNFSLLFSQISHRDRSFL